MRITKETSAPAQSTIFAPETAAPSEETGTALALIGTQPAALIYAPGALTALVDRLKAEVRGQCATLDVSIPKDRARIITLSAKVANSKTTLDKAGESLIVEHRAIVDAVNKDRKSMRDDLDAFKIEVRKPVTDLENAEKDRLAGHEAALAEIAEAGPYTLTNWSVLSVEAIRDRLREIETDPRDWQEFATRATQTKAYAKAQILQAIEAKESHEAAQIELERLRAEAAERDRLAREAFVAEQARKSAEDKARLQAAALARHEQEQREQIEREKYQAEARAMQAEAQRAAAEEKAARDLVEAEERRKREAEQAEARRIRDAEHAEAARKDAEKLAEDDRRQAEAKAKRDLQESIEAERQRVAEDKRRELEEAEKRAKNRAHLAAVNREVLAALIIIGASDELGKAIIAAIVKGEVPHTTIAY